MKKDFGGVLVGCRYQICKKLGGGAEGDVYLAQDLEEGGKKVAIKVV